MPGLQCMGQLLWFILELTGGHLITRENSNIVHKKRKRTICIKYWIILDFLLHMSSRLPNRYKIVLPGLTWQVSKMKGKKKRLTTATAVKNGLPLAYIIVFLKAFLWRKGALTSMHTWNRSESHRSRKNTILDGFHCCKFCCGATKRCVAFV